MWGEGTGRGGGGGAMRVRVGAGAQVTVREDVHAAREDDAEAVAILARLLYLLQRPARMCI